MKKTVLFGSLALALASSGWLYAYRATSGAKPSFIQTMERVGSRALWFGNNTITGQFHVDYGSPVWKEEYLEQRETLPVGKRLRFGKDFWTTFETNIPVTIGGARIEPNYYYLAIERTEESFNLVAYEADRLRAKQIPSFQPPQQGGIGIPMALTEGDDVEDELMIDFVVDNGTGAVTLEVAWGPFTLAAPVEAEIASE